MTAKDLAKARKAPAQKNVATFTECLERGFDDISAFAQDFLDVDMHDGQRKWFNRERNDGTYKMEARESALSCSNRWGKTYSVGVKLLHRAFYQVRDEKFKYVGTGSNQRIRPYRAINIAMSLDQAMQAWTYASAVARNSPRFSQFVVNEIGMPFPRIEISNGKSGKDRIISEIWARSTAKKAKYLLGKSFNFCNYDEAAFDVDGAEILNMVLRARLWDEGGELDMTSSPNGKNWFYQFWLMGQSPDPRYYSRSGPIFENVNPRTGVPNVDLDAIRATEPYMPEDHRRQNIYGEFADFKNVFPITDIYACYKEQEYAHLLPIPYAHAIDYVDTIDGFVAAHTRLLDTPPRYVIGADLARKKDKTVVIVLQLGEDGAAHQLVSCDYLTRTTWAKVYDLITQKALTYGNCPVLVDSTGLLDVVLEELQRRDLRVEGYNLAGQGKDKENLITKGVAAVQSRTVRFPHIDELVKQLTYYAWADKKLETDYVFAFCLAIEAADRANAGEGRVIVTPDSELYIVEYGRYGPRIRGGNQGMPSRAPARDAWPRDEDEDLDDFYDLAAAMF
jgi:hypothetical protein